MTDTEVTYVSWTTSHPIVEALVHSNADIKGVGNSAPIFVGSAKHLDVLIKTGTQTGNATIQFFVDILESDSGSVIRTFDGTALTEAGVDYISINSITIGTYIRLRWTASGGTLDDNNYFAECYSRIIAKV